MVLKEATYSSCLITTNSYQWSFLPLTKLANLNSLKNGKVKLLLLNNFFKKIKCKSQWENNMLPKVMRFNFKLIPITNKFDEWYSVMVEEEFGVFDPVTNESKSIHIAGYGCAMSCFLKTIRRKFVLLCKI